MNVAFLMDIVVKLFRSNISLKEQILFENQLNKIVNRMVFKFRKSKNLFWKVYF